MWRSMASQQTPKMAHFLGVYTTRTRFDLILQVVGFLIAGHSDPL